MAGLLKGVADFVGGDADRSDGVIGVDFWRKPEDFFDWIVVVA